LQKYSIIRYQVYITSIPKKKVYITSKLKALAQTPKEKKMETNRLSIRESSRKPPYSLVVKILSNREQTIAPSKHMKSIILLDQHQISSDHRMEEGT
jgi:hypothetical protein